MEIKLTDNQYETLEGADALIICTEWNEFRTPDFEKMAAKLKSKIIFDGRNLYDINSMKDKGFYYESIGRKTVTK
jgi:UDPglucose 6-dehydrogenase